MFTSKRSIIAAFLLHLVLSARQAECGVKVEIVNYIPWDDPVLVTCSEKHKVLGDPVPLGLHASYEFSCHKSLFGGGSCKCEVKWGDTVRYFDAYRQRRDQSLCGGKCRWYLFLSGPALADASSPHDNPSFKVYYDWGEA
uniref:S-protein homolog n=1 Tax=Kalanchoe fedtschenkoi TaxID=63787 RepID=A0A7N0UJI9_KALFE